MLEKIAKWLTRKPKLVAMMAVLMLIPAAIGYISTRINYDILSYLPEDLESSHGEKLLEEPFKMAATSMLVVESMPAGYTNSLLNDIKAIDGVSNAIWISNLMGIQIPTDMIPANFRDMFFAGDATMMIIQYSHPGASDETMEAIEQVRRACNEKCFLAGFSVVIKDTRDLMDSELPIFVGLAVLLALVAMMVTLESTVLPFIFLASIGLAVIYRNGSTLKGLTTAAGIWATAGIGLAIGAGMYPIGIATTIIIILMQTIMHKFNIGNDALATRDINITMNDTPELRDAFLAELKRMDVSVIGSHITHNNDGTVNYGLTIKFSREIKFEEILAFMDSHPGIRNIAM